MIVGKVSGKALLHKSVTTKKSLFPFIRGCIILLPSKFEGRKQIELANERMSVLSPLFDFLIVVEIEDDCRQSKR